MKSTVKLPDNHRRSLSVAAQFVERTLDEMEELLRSRGRSRLTSKVQAAFSDEERIRLLAALAQMRQANAEMVRALGLEASPYREDRVITAKRTYLWTILVDSKSKGLRGFGQLAPELAEVVDHHVNRLLELLEEIS